MRLLLDENLPKKIKYDFDGHDVFTIKECGWNGLKNGVLLKRMIEREFNALITFDKNMKHQQNFKKYPITVFVLTARINTYAVLTKLTPKIQEQLNQPLVAGPIEIQ